MLMMIQQRLPAAAPGGNLGQQRAAT